MHFHHNVYLNFILISYYLQIPIYFLKSVELFVMSYELHIIISLDLCYKTIYLRLSIH